MAFKNRTSDRVALRLNLRSTYIENMTLIVFLFPSYMTLNSFNSVANEL